MNHGLSAPQVAALLRIRRAWPDHKTVLIGAAALGVHVPMTWRRTADVDLTVMIDLETLGAQLPPLGFRRHPKIEQTWVTIDGNVRLDILPATEADLIRGYLEFPGGGSTMSLAGFDLAMKHTHALPLAADVAIEVAALPVLPSNAWRGRAPVATPSRAPS